MYPLIIRTWLFCETLQVIIAQQFKLVGFLAVLCVDVDGIHHTHTLALEGEEDAGRAVIREIDRDAITRDILHVDLQRISENKPVVMHVPVSLVGESIAVKEGRGILDHTMRQLEVKCLPRDIPEHIEVDISDLEVRHAIHVSDISVANIEILDHPERPVVEVLQPTLFKEPTEEVAEGEEVEGEEAQAFKLREEYGPEILNRFAIDFIDRHKDRPFFLYYPTIIPHVALHVPDDELKPYLELGWNDPY